MDTTPVGLDAAHVRWWAAGGPDTLDHGLALCALHHKALDLGVLGISEEHRIQVSRAFHGGQRAQALVASLAGHPLALPQPGAPTLSEIHRGWHAREVFREPPRQLAAAAEADSPP
ncbi:hypothetical protein ER308_06145 [Egibacter rhizosphaerae]|uniref:HNH endonuclease n=1 Tax=Egibacter rhizosphaerae TaxID=1670831 RepID=A0A411YDB8_9ACTN|nr:hypothetical protein [Egibacter rhizosphaerae]QBI19162.1 hypothetical protein ER308_06145 [Egibacter rhizosphaerae]